MNNEIVLNNESVRVRTCLWFDTGGEEASEFNMSLLPGGGLETDLDGSPKMIVEFPLRGAPYTNLNAGPHFALTPAALSW